MHFLADYGLFLMKWLSLVVGILVLLVSMMALASRGKTKKQGFLSIELLNGQYEQFTDTILAATGDKAHIKISKKARKKTHQHQTESRKRLYVIYFDGDMRASAVSSLRQEVTAVLLAADPQHDEVLVCLESGGGLAHAYGLAASQLMRIKAARIRLTVAVDKVAASGGYMMACVADRIIAAPFAIVGSIGAVIQVPNFYDFLKHNHIHVEQITAGEYKRTLSMLGKNTDKGREKVQDEIDEMHTLFKNHIAQYRPQVPMDQVATGEHWYGIQARDLRLIDELCTSDDFLLQKSKDSQVFVVAYHLKKNWSQKLSHTLYSGFTGLWSRLLGHI